MGITTTELHKNLAHLIKATDSVLRAIWKSAEKIPLYAYLPLHAHRFSFVKDSLINLYLELQKVAPIPKEKLVASIFFLRFICPFIVSPKVTGKDTCLPM